MVEWYFPTHGTLSDQSLISLCGGMVYLHMTHSLISLSEAVGLGRYTISNNIYGIHVYQYPTQTRPGAFFFVVGFDMITIVPHVHMLHIGALEATLCFPCSFHLNQRYTMFSLLSTPSMVVVYFSVW